MKKLVLIAALFLTACSPQNSQNLEVDTDSTGIVGGEQVEGTSAVGRSTVGLYDAKIGYICSGTLIARNLILTAGHCVDPKSQNLVAIFAPEMKKANKEQIRKVSKWIVHPNYSTEIVERDMADIAIVKIEGEAPAGFQVAPLLFNSQLIQNDVRTIVAGYGLNWTIGLKRGAGTLRTTTLTIDKAYYSQTEAMLGQSLRRGICSGDSGGPAYVSINGQLHVWGVASRGDSLPGFLTPKCMLFSVFTRVDAYQTWIEQSIADLK
ncbi:trypsin-like serine protease [Bdellovibrio bacteriovorus]